MITPEDREFWAFRPVTQPAVPALPTGFAGGNPIDAFLLEAMAKVGLGFSPPAEKLTLLLRASFDLTGLPPTSDEIELYLSDTGSDAYDRLLDRLLASPHYGEHGVGTGSMRPAMPSRMGTSMRTDRGPMPTSIEIT